MDLWRGTSFMLERGGWLFLLVVFLEEAAFCRNVKAFCFRVFMLTKYLGIYGLIKYLLWNSPFWNGKAEETDQFRWTIFSGNCTRVQSSWMWQALASSSADLCSKCGRDLITIFFWDTYYFEFPGRSTVTHKGPIRTKEKKPEKWRRGEKKEEKKKVKDFSSEQCIRSVYNLLVCAGSRLPSIFFGSNGCQLCASLLWVQEGEK